MPEVTPCVILLEKTRILCNFIKLSPRSWPAHPLYAFLAGWGPLGRVPQLCSKKPNFMQFYEKTAAPGEQLRKNPTFLKGTAFRPSINSAEDYGFSR